MRFRPHREPSKAQHWRGSYSNCSTEIWNGNHFDSVFGMEIILPIEKRLGTQSQRSILPEGHFRIGSESSFEEMLSGIFEIVEIFTFIIGGWARHCQFV